MKAALVVFNYFVNKSRCDDSKGPETCEKYNRLIEILYPNQRIAKCNNEKNCMFERVGNTLEGKCIQRVIDPFGIDKDEEIENDNHSMINSTHTDDELVENSRDNTLNRVYSDLVGGEGGSMDVKRIKEMVTATAVDSIRDSESTFHNLAKVLLIDIFQNPEHRGNLGNALKYLFSSETVLKPTRELIYYSLHLKDCQNQCFVQAKQQSSYWLRDPAGQKYLMQPLLVDSIAWYLSLSSDRRAMIIPLVQWTIFTEETHTIKNLTAITAAELPKHKVSYIYF
jgi:hypothetical protein